MTFARRCLPALVLPLLLGALAGCDIVTADLRSEETAQWHKAYQLEPNGDGTTLTESWTLRALTPNMVDQGDVEIDRREENARVSIKATLAGMKAAAEAG